MTKRRELERHLRRHGCEQVREGAKHSVWKNQRTGRRSTIPRHRELPPTTAREICKQLGIQMIEGA